MKYLILVILFFSIQNLWAQSCPESVTNDRESLEFVDALKRNQGQFKLGSCLVEIHVCNSKESPDSQTEFAGDILITDRTGFLRYVPIYFVAQKDRKTKQAESEHDGKLLYRFKDKNLDQISGKWEKWAIELKSGKNGIEYIDVGYKNQYFRGNRKFSQKRWVVCGDEREAVYKKSPHFHTLRSWWTWITRPRD